MDSLHSAEIQLASLTERERAKEQRRAELLIQLQKGGIDTSDLSGELNRLRAQLQEHYTQSKARVDKFVAELESAK